jgi:hypothetical protein
VIPLKKLLFTILCALLGLSCSVSNEALQKGEAWTIEQQQAGCLEVCQAYTIRIESNGKFEYNGKFKVKHLGRKTGRLSAKEQLEVQHLVEQINWETIERSYGSNKAQLKVLTYTTKSMHKKTSYYSGEPQSIKDLAHYIETIIEKDEL